MVTERRMRLARESHISEMEALKAQLENMQEEVNRKNRSLAAAMDAMDANDDDVCHSFSFSFLLNF